MRDDVVHVRLSRLGARCSCTRGIASARRPVGDTLLKAICVGVSRQSGSHVGDESTASRATGCVHDPRAGRGLEGPAVR